MGSLENTLDPIAEAMAGRKEGFALIGRPLQGLFKTRGVEITRILTVLVEKKAPGLTLCAPSLTVFHFYVQEPHLPLALCRTGTPIPVARKRQVLMGWFLTAGGLLPAGFECEPPSAGVYLLEMEGR